MCARPLCNVAGDDIAQTDPQPDERLRHFRTDADQHDLGA
jgi:hypothetical protein